MYNNSSKEHFICFTRFQVLALSKQCNQKATLSQDNQGLTAALQQTDFSSIFQRKSQPPDTKLPPDKTRVAWVKEKMIQQSCSCFFHFVSLPKDKMGIFGDQGIQAKPFINAKFSNSQQPATLSKMKWKSYFCYSNIFPPNHLTFPPTSQFSSNKNFFFPVAFPRKAGISLSFTIRGAKAGTRSLFKKILSDSLNRFR